MATTLKHAFAELPAPGFILEDQGFRYEVVSARPHINQRGEPSAVITWRGRCAEDGQPFEFKTGARVYSLARRCKAHNRGWAAAIPFRDVTAMAERPGFQKVLIAMATEAREADDEVRYRALYDVSAAYARWKAGDDAKAPDDDGLFS